MLTILLANLLPRQMTSSGCGAVGIPLLALTILCSGNVHGSEVIEPADMLDWQRRDFAGPTNYRLNQRDGHTLLQARCEDAASALYLEKTIDLRKTPILEWSWTADSVFNDVDETQKSGDDYPVRLYVVKDGGLLGWRTRAVNYVWSSGQPIGATWSNAYASQAEMLALRSGAPGQPGLVTERRNVREDFQRLHGLALDTIDGLAIMTDCDDSGQSGTGWYGDIRWLTRE